MQNRGVFMRVNSGNPAGEGKVPSCGTQQLNIRTIIGS